LHFRVESALVIASPAFLRLINVSTTSSYRTEAVATRHPIYSSLGTQSGRRLGKKVFLILDNLGVHHCKPVKAWLAEHVADIEVFYLPSYSPELNPNTV
jgi:transposase